MKTIRLITIAAELCAVPCGQYYPFSKRENIIYRTPYGELNEHVKRKQNE